MIHTFLSLFLTIMIIIAHYGLEESFVIHMDENFFWPNGIMSRNPLTQQSQQAGFQHQHTIQHKLALDFNVISHQSGNWVRAQIRVNESERRIQVSFSVVRHVRCLSCRRLESHRSSSGTLKRTG